MLNLHHVIEVAPLDHTRVRWEITNTDVLIAKGTSVYTLPLVELDTDDDLWFMFGYCVAKQVVEDYGEYALVLFEGVQSGDALFSVFWVHTQFLDESFHPST
jgi:hypothetical protein